MPITLPGDPPPNPSHRWIVPTVLVVFTALLVLPFVVVKVHDSKIETNQNAVIDAMRGYARKQAEFFEKQKRYAASFEELGGEWAQVQDMRALKPTQYHGYRFRAFTSRSKFAQGGERNYVDASGQMTGGYALMAVPIEYGYSGRFTFFIADPGDELNFHDLGMKTDTSARAIDQYFVPPGAGVMKGK